MARSELKFYDFWYIGSHFIHFELKFYPNEVVIHFNILQVSHNPKNQTLNHSNLTSMSRDMGLDRFLVAILELCNLGGDPGA